MLNLSLLYQSFGNKVHKSSDDELLYCFYTNSVSCVCRYHWSFSQLQRTFKISV